MKIDIAYIEAQIAKMREEKHSVCFLEGVVAHDAKSIDSLERVYESAAFYGDSQKVATLIQLVFIRTLLKRPVDGEVWATAALDHMPQELLIPEELATEDDLEEERREIREAQERFRKGELDDDDAGC